MAVNWHKVAIHEAGHVIATLDCGCLLYSCTIGTSKHSVKNSAGHVYGGTQTIRQSAVIGIAGALSNWLHEKGRDDFNMTAFLDYFTTDSQYANDLTDCKGYSLSDAAYECKKILLLRWGHLERLSGKLVLPANRNREIGAAELFQMTGCRLLDSRKLPVPKRKVQIAMDRFRERGYHQWLRL